MFAIGGENVLRLARIFGKIIRHYKKKAGHYCPAVRIFFTSFTSASISSNRSAYRVIVPIACSFTS